MSCLASPRENSFGEAKRLVFIDQVIRSCRPQTVLDIGCGTGDLLTAPLAAAHPNVRFCGADNDDASLAHAAARHQLPNIQFVNAEGLGDARRFDLVIASEVLEHVEQPGDFLVALHRRLNRNGTLVLTVPNGYGPAELGATVEALLQLSGSYRLLRTVWRALGFKRAVAWAAPQASDSLALSPHINFFRYAEVVHLIRNAGFQQLQYRPRTFMCGFGFDQLVALFRLIEWNARVADRLPPPLVSDWMFVSQASAAMPAPASPYRRGRLARLRRELNRRRWRLA
jgi:SAM-dependent methyltransferase